MTSLAMPSPLVGRERELAVLRERLTAASEGSGSLVLIGGEAGIGKTALAEALCREATEQGVPVLVGRCYDLTETPPYGPWVELFAPYDPSDTVPVPGAFARRGTVGEVASPAVLVQQVLEFTRAVATHRPLLLLLDDLHWADPASLDLLRSFARNLARLPVLTLVTYRVDELTRRHPLYNLLPLLEREANAYRVGLRPLEPDALRTLVSTRYHLPDHDAASLVPALYQRAEGNAFFTMQLLRAFEEEGVLWHTDNGWVVGDLTSVHVPVSLQQTIDRRLARLGEDAQHLLALAAVIGHEVPVAVWAAVAEIAEDALLATIERAVEARLLDEMPDGTRVRFVHALIREASYERVLAARRRRMHLRVGGLLAALPTSDPDAVASHFERAGDAQAVEWLVRAGDRAERAYAWLTAAERFTAALALLAGSDATAAERGWLLVRLARMLHFVDPIQAIARLDEAQQLATKAGDRLLAATALYTRGKTGLFVTGSGDYQQALDEVTRGAEALEGNLATPSSYATRFAALDRPAEFRGTLLYHVYAMRGRYAEASQLVARFLDQADPATGSGGYRGSGSGNGFVGVGEIHAMFGRPHEAQAAMVQARATHRRDGHLLHAAWAATAELYLVLLPYRTDRLEQRRRVAAEGERDYERAGEAGWRVSPRVGSLPLMIVEGDWIEARRLASAVVTAPDEHVPRQFARMVLGLLAREQGDPGLAWEQVHVMLPTGPATRPGIGVFFHQLAIQRLAAALALDRDDRTAARAWLEAHDRWLTWSGALLGRSEGHALWARYYRSTNNMRRAAHHAEQALACATEPRQPLALLAAHRLIGELNTMTGRIAYAATHLDAALNLATACATPYERALTLLSLIELHAATNQRAKTSALLDEIRTICVPLAASLALTKADALAARLAGATVAAPPSYPAGLSAREVEVLRHMAAGESNRDIADVLCLSERTVQVHVRHILTKTGADNRAGATAFALRNDLA